MPTTRSSQTAMKTRFSTEYCRAPNEGGADEHDHRLQHVARPPEERVDRLLRLVLHLAAGRQEQRLARGVLNRVVARVLQGLGDADNSQHREEGDERVARERDEREDEQRPAHADVLEDAGHQEHLEQQAEQVHVGLKSRDVAADPLPTRRLALGIGHRRTSRGHDASSLALEHLVEDEAAERVDDVEHDEEEPDEEQVPLAQHQLESALARDRLPRCGVLVRAVLTAAGAFPPVDPEGEAKADHQAGNAQEHQRIWPRGLEDGRCQLRARPGTDGCADADDRQEPFAAIVGVHVVGQRPELCRHHQVEDADPDVERDADAHARLAEGVEDEQVRREEEGDERREPHAIELRREAAVERDDAEEKGRLRRR